MKSKRICVTSGSIFFMVSSQVVIPFDRSGKSGLTKYVMLLMTSSEQVAVTGNIEMELGKKLWARLTNAADAETKSARAMRGATLDPAFVGVHADAWWGSLDEKMFCQGVCGIPFRRRSRDTHSSSTGTGKKFSTAKNVELETFWGGSIGKRGCPKF